MFHRPPPTLPHTLPHTATLLCSAFWLHFDLDICRLPQKCLHTMKGFIWFARFAIFLVSPPVTLVVLVRLPSPRPSWCRCCCCCLCCCLPSTRLGPGWGPTPFRRHGKWKINIKHMLVLNKSLKFPYGTAKCGATTGQNGQSRVNMNEWQWCMRRGRDSGGGRDRDRDSDSGRDEARDRS